MSVIGSNILAGAAGAAGATEFKIERSLRFDSDASSDLTRTPSSAGNRKTFTWSGWVKRSKLGATQGRLFGGGTSGYFDLYFPSGDELRVLWTGNNLTTTTALFRDPSAWYHIVLAVDTTQSTAADRIKIYVNGVLQSRDSTNPSQNYDTEVNNTVAHHIGRYAGSTSTSYFDGYLANVNFIDGQALAPTDFGEYDDNGVWQPKEYSGTYGTNGFNLDFADPADLGNDNSGQGNDWTPNNLVGTAPGLSTADQGFGVVTYTGTGNDLAVSGLNFQSDLVWIKTRNEAENLFVVDSVRGVTKQIYTTSDATEYTNSNRFKSFDSNGFTVGTTDDTNQNTNTFVAWAWKAGGTASSNTAGTITSTVSANNTYGFSIVKYTGQTNAQTVGHGCPSAPKFIITKNLDRQCDWIVYHESLDSSNPEDKFLRLNEDDGPTTSADYWGSGGVTNSVFGVDNGVFVNINTEEVIAYCWSEIAGYSKFSSFTGTGAAGNKITTGFKPAFVLIKRTTNISGDHMGWVLLDSVRGGTKKINVNHTAKENDGPINAAVSPNDEITFQEDGFTLISGGSATNGNNETYVFAAFADKPDSSAIDSLIDTPTNYDADSGNNGGNYATMSPVGRTDSAYFTENGNLVCGNSSLPSGSSGSRGFIPSTIGFKTGKWYAEVQTTAASDGDVDFAVGIYPATSTGYYSTSGHYAIRPTGHIYSPSGAHQSYGSTWTDTDIIGIAVDMDSSTKTVQFFKNGSSMASATTIADKEYFFGYGSDGGGSSRTYKATWNFGQRPFKYPPGGTGGPAATFKSLCTQNLPDPTIADGSTGFDTKTWSGNNSSTNSTPRNVDTYKFSPDLVWIKNINSTEPHNIYDTVRGEGKYLYPHDTNQGNDAGNYGLTGFLSNGFSLLDQGPGYWSVNADTRTYVGWAWDAGANSNKTYTVKVVSDSGNKYRFDDFGTSAVTLDLEEGSTYVFDQSDSSNATHPLRFATAADAAGGTEYTSGVTTTGTPGQAGAKTTITVASGAPTLYYYCSNHSGMGGQVNTNSTAGASNLAGSIQSTVRVNPEIGFSIVTASASSAGDSIGHGLNAAPSLIIAKRTGATSHWPIYHSSIGANGFLYLNLTNLAGTGANFWNNSAPTSSVFTVGSDSAVTGGTTVFYCFTSVNQYSSFGSYTGNGSSDGPFVFTGFRPRWIMVKMSSAGGNWDIFDTARDSSNVASNVLRADSSADEFSTPTGTYGIALDALSNGFKLRSGSATNDVNDTGETFIYAAFAEHPFKTARAR